jgi:hypothetical protein
MAYVVSGAVCGYHDKREERALTNALKKVVG